MQDRAGDQMRKISNEQAVVHQIIFTRLALPGVDQKGNLGKREERDAQWQQNLSGAQPGIGQGIEIVEKEIGVLVVAEQCQVGDDRPHEQAPAASLVFRRDRPGNRHAGGVVKENGT